MNNNVVIAEDPKNGKEKIVMHNGLGFQNKVGSYFNPDETYKIFTLPDETYAQYEKLTENISPMAVEIAETVITYASETKGLELNDLIHITLTDHIDGVISRLEKGISLSNQLTMEISRVYDMEFEIGLYTVELIRKKLGKMHFGMKRHLSQCIF